MSPRNTRAMKHACSTLRRPTNAVSMSRTPSVQPYTAAGRPEKMVVDRRSGSHSSAPASAWASTAASLGASVVK